MKAATNLLCGIVLMSCAAIPASAATLTITTTGPNTGAVSVLWSTGNFVCNPFGGGMCTIPDLAPGTELRVSANSPGGSFPGVIIATTGDAGGCLPTSTCRFTINTDSSMTVTFGPGDHRSVTVVINGTGNIGINNNQCQNFELGFSACTTRYGVGSEVTLQGRVTAGNNFVDFSGGTNDAAGCGPASTCVFTLNEDSEVTANFAHLTSIAVQPISAEVSVGGGQNFTATGMFSAGPSRPIMFGQGLWQPRASLSSARFSLAAAAFNNRVYAFGGTAGVCTGSPCPFGPLDTVEMFNPVTNSWTTNVATSTPFAPIPTPREGAAAAVLGVEIFVVGGHTSGGGAVADVASFNPASNVWTTRPAMPTARAQLALAVIGNVMYAVGGEAGPGGSPAVATVEAFSLSAGTWATLPSMPVAAKFLAAVAVDGTLYVIGGSPATVYAFNPATEVWTTKSVMPTHRSAMKAGVLDGLIYVIGGNAGGATNVVEIYNPQTNSWAAATSMPAARSQFGLGVLDGRLFAVGGLQSPSTVISAVHALRPSEGTWWSSDSSVATINSFGFAVGAAEGSTSIIAKAVALDCQTSGDCGTLNVNDDGGGGEEVCATLTLTLGADSAVISQVGVRVIDPATAAVLFTFDAPIGEPLEVPDQPFRLEFIAPDGLTVTPSEFDLDASCGDALTVQLNFAPIAPPTPPELIAGLMADAAAADFGQAANLLRNALAKIEGGNVSAACNQLAAFINQVRAQSGKNLTAEEVNALVESAAAVRSSLGCQ